MIPPTALTSRVPCLSVNPVRTTDGVQGLLPHLFLYRLLVYTGDRIQIYVGSREIRSSCIKMQHLYLSLWVMILPTAPTSPVPSLSVNPGRATDGVTDLLPKLLTYRLPVYTGDRIQIYVVSREIRYSCIKMPHLYRSLWAMIPPTAPILLVACLSVNPVWATDGVQGKSPNQLTYRQPVYTGDKTQIYAGSKEIRSSCIKMPHL